ncbi:hypothetical protein ACF08N_36680 [Streptomyces sp. NPDC015127]|uniref:hypothetical protein n=1 Tax=Streptomyces sp. NPDC015127 TaxID=3364939 RepID=UPI0036FA8287
MTDFYATAALSGKNLDEFYGVCAADADRLRANDLWSDISKEELGNRVKFVASSGSQESSSMNLLIGEGRKVVVQLKLENKEWKVCSALSGHIQIEVD